MTFMEFSTGHKNTNIQTILEILHQAHKCPKLNELEQFEIYNHCKTQKNDILNSQIWYNYILYNVKLVTNIVNNIIYQYSIVIPNWINIYNILCWHFRCKPGFFNLDAENEFGCTPCFCYGHSSVCRSAPGYSRVEIESTFARGTERWSGLDYAGNSVPIQYNGITQAIGVSAPGRDRVYFVAPGNLKEVVLLWLKY